MSNTSQYVCSSCLLQPSITPTPTLALGATQAAAPMDPNWFFSTLTQSAAAIVGILGAILLSRLLQQLAVNRETKLDILEQYKRLRHKLQVMFLAFEGYSKWLTLNIPVIEEALTSQEQPIVTVARFRNFYKNEGYGSERVDRTTLAQCQRDIDWCRRSLPTLEAMLVNPNIAQVVRNNNSLHILGIDSPVGAKEDLQALAKELRYLARRTYIFEGQVLPTSVLFFLLSLGYLSIAGVLAPLWFLYSGPDELRKWVLFLLFAMGLFFVTCCFIWLVRETLDAAILVLTWEDDLIDVHDLVAEG